MMKKAPPVENWDGRKWMACFKTPIGTWSPLFISKDKRATMDKAKALSIEHTRMVYVKEYIRGADPAIDQEWRDVFYRKCTRTETARQRVTSVNTVVVRT